MTEKDILYIWFSLCFNYSSVKMKKLYYEMNKDIEMIYNAKVEEYPKIGLSCKNLEKLSNKNLSDAIKIKEITKKLGASVLTIEGDFYPERLRKIAEPPFVLYYKGELKDLSNEVVIGSVGTRYCSAEGYETAYEISAKLSCCGACIATGMASGIDTACANGAIDYNGYVIGVMGTGFDKIYPTQNKKLFEILYKRGLIITEYPPNAIHNGGSFPRRNRIISALSLSVIVFEAGEKSGALITAQYAQEQDKPLYALAGGINSNEHFGTNLLIKNGAKILTSCEDILNEYVYSFSHKISLKALEKFKLIPKEKIIQNKQSKEKVLIVEKSTNCIEEHSNDEDISFLSTDESKIYCVFNKECLTAEEICSNGFDMQIVLTALTMLEIGGLIESLPGGVYRKIKK